MFVHNSARKLTTSYVVALCVIASLATTDFVIQRIILRDSEATQRIKDITATQRTIVQSIAFLAQRMSLETVLKERESRQSQIGELMTRLDRSLEMMDQDFRILSSRSFPFIENLTPLYYTEALGLRRQLDEFRMHVRKLIETDVRQVGPDNAHVTYIVQTAETELYNVLDMFVTLTVLDTQKRLSSLGVVDAVAYAFVLIVLFITGVFIFKPVVSAVIRQQINQAQANERLGERAEALEQSRLKLRKQTRILSSVLNTMADGLIVVDEHGRLLIQNPAADRLFGPAGEGISIEEWHRLSGMHDLDTNKELALSESPVYRALFSQRFNESLLKIHNRSTSAPKIISAMGRKMLDEENVMRGAVISFHDVSDRVLKEQELMESKIRAESANISKTQFLANISHEIRTPMGAILGYADRLLISSISNNERHDIVQVIRRNARNLMNIIDDLLDISRIEAGQLSIEKQQADPAELCSEVYALLSNKADEKGLSFDFRFSGPLPIHIQTDPMRLRQVLINVIGNAIKFTEKGGISVVVRIVPGPTAVSARLLEFEVHDTGCGIRAESTHKLFKPFAQVDSSTTRKFGGTGLGLNLSRRMARALGGDLVLSRTEFGKGSVFTVSIDPGDLSGVKMIEHTTLKSRSLSAREDNAESMFPTSGLGGAHILIVDDGEENRELFSYYLTLAGAKVGLASDGVEGIEQALSNDYDLVLLDIQMPRLDGYQTISRLRAQGYKVPIVALTAHAMKEERERCKAAGFDDHLAKPINARALVDAAARYVKAYRAQAQASEQKPSKGAYSAPDNVIPMRQGPSVIDNDLPPQVRDIIRRFVRSLPAKIEEMLSALSADDFKRFQGLVHKLKGTAGACGLNALMNEMEMIEEIIAETHSHETLNERVLRIKSLVPQEFRDVLG